MNTSNKRIDKTFEDLKIFVLEQPDDRRLNMQEPQSEAECGCLLIQFARLFNLPEPYRAGYSTVGQTDNESQGLPWIQFDQETEQFFFRISQLNETTYATIKTYL